MRRFRRRSRLRGFTYLELVAIVAILSLVVGIAVPSYRNAVDRARVSKAIGDIGTLELAIERFRLSNQDRVPADLNELGMPLPTDPYGRDYVYYNIRANGIGGARKDARLNPLNTDFDLYSQGKDGESAAPLSAQQARDDIVRANNGDYVGLGKDY